MKKFLIINTSYFGDTILTGSLCQNIKIEYPASKVIFIANSPYCEAARYMKGVDEVWGYDKSGEHSGFAGFWRFYKEYKGKYDFDASFVIYGNQRNILLSKFLGAKKIYADNNGMIRCLLNNRKIDYGERLHVQDRHGFLFELHANKKTTSAPIHYQPPQEAFLFSGQLFLSLGIDMEKADLVAICTTTKHLEKNMEVDQCADLIHGLRKMGKVPLLVGTGPIAESYAEKLLSLGCNDFIDLTNKTTIAQLGAVIKSCSSVVSVDTGTLHFALVLGVPVVAIFYINHKKNINLWAPKSFYRHRLIADGDYSAQKMLQYVTELDSEREKHIYID